jgi:hypothetical protein
MTKKIEVDFSRVGNTVVGNYFDYLSLDAAISKKLLCNSGIMFPEGLFISGEKSDIARLADYVLTFGGVIKSKKAWENACRLAGVDFQFKAVQS